MAGEVPDMLPSASAAALASAPAARAASGTAAPLRGTRKAAVLVAAIGSQRAAAVLKRLSPEEVERISLELARLRPVAAEMAESVFSELAVGSTASHGSVAGGIDFTREVIEHALGPDRAVELLGRLSAGAEPRPFAFLERLPAARVAAMLEGESPQTAALVIANLPAAHAASVLAAVPEREQPEISRRIVRMGRVGANAIARVEEVLRGRLGEDSGHQHASVGGARALADILGHAERSLERNVLEALARSDSSLAEEVRGMMFVFEDIVKLDERSIQQVLREVDQKDLVLALRGAPDGVLDVVLANMSERGAAMLKEEMELQQPKRKREIDQAQSRIVAVVRKLEEAGTIVIGGEEEEQREDEKEEEEEAEAVA